MYPPLARPSSSRPNALTLALKAGLTSSVSRKERSFQCPSSARCIIDRNAGEIHLALPLCAIGIWR